MELIVRQGERQESVHLERDGEAYLVRIGDQEYRVDLAHVGDRQRSFVIDGQQRELSVSRQGDGRYRVGGAEIEVLDPLAHLARDSHGEGAGGGTRQVTAYMPGRVASILVAEGEEVTAGQGVIVLEAMKMENEIAAEASGTVSRIFVEEGQAVEGGDPLFELS